MKKYLLIIIAMVYASAISHAQSVYIATGSGAIAYHKSKSCGYLAHSKEVKSVSLTSARNIGRRPCTRCYNTASATSSSKTKTTRKISKTEPKAIKKTTKSKTNVTKKVAKTTEKVAKKMTPKEITRDAKGRFVSTKKTTTNETVKPKLTRDAKGRFVSTKKTAKKKAVKKSVSKAKKEIKDAA